VSTLNPYSNIFGTGLGQMSPLNAQQSYSQQMNAMNAQQAMSQQRNFQYDVYRMSNSEITNHIAELQCELDKRTLYDRASGPSRHELLSHESLANAWSEYLTIRKLLGLKD
jgi:hypothetical protein